MDRIAVPEVTNRARKMSLLNIEADLMLPPDPMTRLAAALEDQDAARAISSRLKVSNEERARLVAALGADERIVSFLSMREVRRVLYKLGEETFRDRVMLAWAEAGAGEVIAMDGAAGAGALMCARNCR